MEAPRPSERIRVVVRVRPPSDDERRAGHATAVSADGEQVRLAQPSGPPGRDDHERVFTFDSAFGPASSQEEVYTGSAAPIVESVLDGFNGTVIAYGQTGAGKSHTMEGTAAAPGLIPQSFRHVFERIAVDAAPGRQALVRASYLEVYNEEVRDLLARDRGGGGRLELKEHPETGVYVKDLTSCVVTSAAETAAILQAGQRNRATAATLMNAQSSRSHSIFTVTVETSEQGADGATHFRVGKLNMVDLAGSERQSKTGATGQRLKEASKINLSLSALGNVISALVDDKAGAHVPYRDSKLTRLLQDSLGGNTKTVMVANCGPSEYNYDETLSTLRYASRAKCIKNRPRVNEDPKDAMLREFQDEIARLRQRLAQEEGKERPGEAGEWGAGDANDCTPIADDWTHTAVREKRMLEQQLQELQEKLLVGSEAAAQASRQAEELRRAQMELETRRHQEASLARELEEANLVIEEQYASMADELAAKSSKLNKMWAKLQQAEQSARDVHADIQHEREEFLDVLHELSKQLKLKQVVIDKFVPPDMASSIEARATWSDSNESWSIARSTLSGTSLRLTWPSMHSPTTSGAEQVPSMSMPRMASSRQLGAVPMSRYKADNPVDLGEVAGQPVAEVFTGSRSAAFNAMLEQYPLL